MAVIRPEEYCGGEQFINSVHVNKMVNCYAYPVYINISSLQPNELIPCIALIATSAIPYGKPILTNYNPRYEHRSFFGDCYCELEYSWPYCPGRIEKAASLSRRRDSFQVHEGL